MGRNGVKAALLTAVFIVSAGSCSVQPKESSSELFAMDTLVTVKAYGGSDEAVHAASDRLRTLEKLLSVTDENSEIYRVNSADGSPVTVSRETAELVSRALDMCERTDGALDITVYPVLREWGFTTGEYKVPSETEIADALGYVGYENAAVSGSTVSLPSGCMLDLGACAKGYAGDAMSAVLRENGVTSAIINLGGNVQTLGSKPDGSEWRVGIANPYSPNEIIGTVSVSGKAVVTSGGYQRYFTDSDGNIRIHIIDPRTGMPAESGIISMTVIGNSGFECDALSTALFVMGSDGAVKFWRKNGGFDMIFVTEDGKCAVTENIADSFTDLAGLQTSVIRSSDEQR